MMTVLFDAVGVIVESTGMRICTRHDPLLPCCDCELPVEDFGIDPDKNPRCMVCRRFEGVYARVLNCLNKLLPITPWSLPVIDTTMRQILYRRFTKKIEPMYQKAWKIGGKDLVDRLMPIWYSDCLWIAIRYAKVFEWEPSFFEDEEIPEESGAATILYMGVRFSNVQPHITEGIIFGKTSALWKPLKRYNGEKRGQDYFEYITTFETGPGYTDDIELRIKRLKSDDINKLEILYMPWPEGVALVQDCIRFFGLDPDPIATEWNGQGSSKRCIWEEHFVKAALVLMNCKAS